jgi:cytochrome c oxidase assembly protein subunit 11
MAIFHSRYGKYITLFGLLCAIGVMTTLVSYSVTLYRLFCQVTGAYGTTQRTSADRVQETSRMVTVSFDTNVAPGMNWRFEPVQRQVRVHLGQDTLVFFRAENLTDHEMVGHATFNITPLKVGQYFKKIECFCFTEERLGPHQSVEMPVDFYVDPRIATNPNTAEVGYLTLSYTFFESLRPKGAEDLARFENRPSDATAGQKLFATSCADCHELDRNKVGPMLDDVVGRVSGTVAGYPYTPALANSHIVWDGTTLDRWLAGPSDMLPGSAMPFRLPDELSRKDVIAYLQTLKGKPR